MPLTVKLPGKEQKEEYSLFVSSKITYLHKEPGYGTLINCEGCGVAFYSARNSRRAIVFSELSEKDFGLPLQEGKIPYFKEPVRILYKAKGRRIDLLKFMCYSLEEKYGKKIYGLGNVYWLTLASYIDSLARKTFSRDKNSRQLCQITDRYCMHKKVDGEKK